MEEISLKNAHNKITLTLLLGLCTLLLGACGQNTTNTTSSNTKTTDNSSNAKKHSTAKSFYSKNSSNQSSSVWNDTKDDKLASFMVTWGQTMKQSYTQCTPDRNTTYTGLHYPNDFSDNKTAFSNHKLSAGWSPDGSNKYKVNVVAIYEDTNGGSTIGGRIYLFTIQDHTPVVYYTEQNQGIPDGLVHFEPTQNTDLSNGFKNIVNSKKTATPKSATTKSSNKSGSSDTNDQKFVFPSRMQGTWYAYTDEDKIQTVSFDGNLWKSMGKTDKAFEASRHPSEITYDANDTSKDNWVVATFMESNDGIFKGDENPSRIVNIRVWYQGSGDGTYYYNTTQTVDGKKIEVLTEAGGAMIATTAHYYKSPALAKEYASNDYYADHHGDD